MNNQHTASISRKLLYLILLTLMNSCQLFVGNDERFLDNWIIYQSLFIDTSGRVIDTGNQNMSHSEGQGYAMLLAVAANDQSTFNKIWLWTKNTLQRSDSLFAWHYSPSKAITDANNATDGDILIAWALLRANEHWSEPGYQREALSIVSSIKNKLIHQWHDETVLLPGEHGFIHKDGSITINLSYWIFPAFQAFVASDNDPIWNRLFNSGLKLLTEAKYGRWQLPPDWLRLSDTLNPEPQQKPVFGYNAVRIPLHLAWCKLSRNEIIEPYLHFWNDTFNFQPAWTNLDDDSISSYPASAGMLAINDLLKKIHNREWYRYNILSQQDDYYSASLLLLSQLIDKDVY